MRQDAGAQPISGEDQLLLSSRKLELERRIREEHRILLDRLRRIAQKSGIGTPEQLDLFPH